MVIRVFALMLLLAPIRIDSYPLDAPYVAPAIFVVQISLHAIGSRPVLLPPCFSTVMCTFTAQWCLFTLRLPGDSRLTVSVRLETLWIVCSSWEET